MTRAKLRRLSALFIAVIGALTLTFGPEGSVLSSAAAEVERETLA